MRRHDAKLAASLAQGCTLGSTADDSTTCACSTTAQMREADRRTIEEIGIPSLVLMENAGRQVVAAMEATFDGPARPCASPCSAAAATTAATASSSRARCSQRGVDVGGVPDRRRRRGQGRRARQPRDPRPPRRRRRRDRRCPAWELHVSEVLGSRPDRRRALRHRAATRRCPGSLETVVADVNASAHAGGVDRSAERPVGRQPGRRSARPSTRR